VLTADVLSNYLDSNAGTYEVVKVVFLNGSLLLQSLDVQISFLRQSLKHFSHCCMIK